MTKKRHNAAIYLLVLLSMICGAAVWYDFSLPEARWCSETVKPVPVAKKQSFTPLQVQLLPWQSHFLADKNKPVKGLALGYFLQQNDIEGLSVALMHSSNAKKSGISLSLVELSGESSGLAMFLAGGMVRNKGLSIALWNMAEENKGLQFGIINQAQNNLIVEYGLKPVEKNESFGVQAGMLNYSEGKGIQFGLWNTNPNSFLKHFPIINICF